MSKQGELAYQYFMQGFNCSQSVAAAFSKELGLPEESVLRMTAGFGAGMGHLAKLIVPAGWDTSENKPWAWGSPSWLIQQLTLHRSATLSHRKKQTFLPLPEGPSRPPVPDRPAHTVRYAPKPNR